MGNIAPYMHFTLEAPNQHRKLHKLGVEIVTYHMPSRIEPGAVVATHVYDEDGHEHTWEADGVVLVTQRRSNEALYRELKDVVGFDALGEEGIDGLYRIGDCEAPRLIADCVFSGHRLAREIDSENPEVPKPFIRERRRGDRASWVSWRARRLKVVVCVKQVAVLGDEVEFTADGATSIPTTSTTRSTSGTRARPRRRSGSASGSARARSSSSRSATSEAEAALRRCLAMGADRAIRVEPSRPLDPFSTARALAGVVAAESPDLVLCGVQSSDSVQAATGTALAELLGLARGSRSSRRSSWSGAGPATVDRELEGGLVDVVEVDTPALLTIQTGINQPRYANLRAIKQAEQQEIAVVGRPSGGEPAYRVRRMFSPPRGAGAEILSGGPAEVAAADRRARAGAAR